MNTCSLQRSATRVSAKENHRGWTTLAARAGSGGRRWTSRGCEERGNEREPAPFPLQTSMQLTLEQGGVKGADLHAGKNLLITFDSTFCPWHLPFNQPQIKTVFLRSQLWMKNAVFYHNFPSVIG